MGGDGYEQKAQFAIPKRGYASFICTWGEQSWEIDVWYQMKDLG